MEVVQAAVTTAARARRTRRLPHLFTALRTFTAATLACPGVKRPPGGHTSVVFRRQRWPWVGRATPSPPASRSIPAANHRLGRHTAQHFHLLHPGGSVAPSSAARPAYQSRNLRTPSLSSRQHFSPASRTVSTVVLLVDGSLLRAAPAPTDVSFAGGRTLAARARSTRPLLASRRHPLPPDDMPRHARAYAARSLHPGTALSTQSTATRGRRFGLLAHLVQLRAPTHRCEARRHLIDDPPFTVPLQSVDVKLST